ncbi:hypothetical protein C0995_015538 [Termitomyces sp. Mi166|nr:hypothetical protein C0995_015538 [Termitomyces sp. Mi166\
MDLCVAPSAGPLPFGEIFDLDLLRRNLQKPLLEWSDVKFLPPRLSLDAPSSIEQFGCWSARPPNQEEPILAQNLLHYLGLDISYTRLPEYIRQDPLLAAHAHIALMPLAEKIYPLNPLIHPGDEVLMAPSPNGAKLSPSNHLSCFDFMYFASVGRQPYELAKFLVSGLECLAPLSAYARKIKEVQGAIFVKFGIKVTEVLMTSDEKDQAFWRGVHEEGWKYIDHSAERTLDQHGEWYIPILDIVAQSMGIGFVGSVDSTVSIVSAHRVEDWNQGITRMVNWGGRDAP